MVLLFDGRAGLHVVRKTKCAKSFSTYSYASLFSILALRAFVCICGKVGIGCNKEKDIPQVGSKKQDNGNKDMCIGIDANQLAAPWHGYFDTPENL